MFVGQVPPEVRAAYREAMGDVVAHYADRYAAQVPEFGFYVGADLDAMHAVFTELRGGNPEGFRRGGVVLPAPDSTRVMLIADPSVNTSRLLKKGLAAAARRIGRLEAASGFVIVAS